MGPARCQLADAAPCSPAGYAAQPHAIYLVGSAHSEPCCGDVGVRPERNKRPLLSFQRLRRPSLAKLADGESWPVGGQVPRREINDHFRRRDAALVRPTLHGEGGMDLKFGVDGWSQGDVFFARGGKGFHGNPSVVGHPAEF